MEELGTYVRFDWAIKRLLRQKANFGVLNGFLTVMLGEKVEVLEIIESDDDWKKANDNFNRVDIKALNSKDEIIIVEIQNTREVHYLELICYGVAKSIPEYMPIGQSYREIKKVYSISILYFDLGIGTDYFYHGQNHFIGMHTGDHLRINTRDRDAIVPRLPAEIFPEYILIRVNEFDKVASSPLDEWIKYLKDGTIRPDTTAPGLGEAREKLQYYSMSPKERRAYDEHLNVIMIQNDVLETAKWEGLIEGKAEGREEGLEEGLAKGREEGLEEGLAKGLAKGLEKGEKKKQVEIARNLKALSLPLETIMQATGLSAEEIESIS